MSARKPRARPQAAISIPMKTFNALIKKNKEGKIEDIVLVKDGFSFSSFFFSGLWFLYHKMWHEFFALMMAGAMLCFFGDFIPSLDKFFLQLAFVFIVALNSNDWFCEHLKKKNYEFVGLVFGDDYASAKMRFVKNLKADYEIDPSDFDDSILNPTL